MFLISFLFYQPRPPLFTQQTTTIDHHYSPSKPPQTTIFNQKTQKQSIPNTSTSINNTHKTHHYLHQQNPLCEVIKEEKKTTVWVRKIREETKERKREESQRLNIERRKTNKKSERKREKIILFYLYILAIVSSKYPYLL